MTIILDCGSYHLQNLGDIAMLQVTEQQMRKFWPEAGIYVLTLVPKRLAEFCPLALPLSTASRYLWLEQHLKRISHKEQWEQFLHTAGAQITAKPEEFNQVFAKTDAVVVSGGGFMNDIFIDHAIDVLDMLGEAQNQGKCTAMFGQGFGPVTNPALLERMNQVLPRLAVVGLREKLSGRSLVKNLGVTDPQIFVTGDDSLALAPNREKPGESIGVNLRLSYYSEVTHNQRRAVKEAVLALTGELETKLVPLPISFYPQESDVKSLTSLFPAQLYRYPLERDEESTVQSALARAASCRTVITGSYHGAVFALACGVPVVALSGSTYYLDKFLGLADLFPEGAVQIVGLADRFLRLNLQSATRKAWAKAHLLKEKILQSAKEQAQLRDQAYERFYAILEP